MTGLIVAIIVIMFLSVGAGYLLGLQQEPATPDDAERAAMECQAAVWRRFTITDGAGIIRADDLDAYNAAMTACSADAWQQATGG